MLYSFNQDWTRHKIEKSYYTKMMEETKSIKIEGAVGPSKVVIEIEPETPWDLIFKAVFTVLSTALGLALIKKYVK